LAACGVPRVACRSITRTHIQQVWRGARGSRNPRNQVATFSIVTQSTVVGSTYSYSQHDIDEGVQRLDKD
ncbi:MAG: hypothetical protein KDA69_09745, partial [Planctomycetaceae bacterium]|nr:hypothetical protein [Planctomycetaceae bacterium]